MEVRHLLDLDEVASRTVDGVAAMEPDGRVVVWNGAAEALLGRSAADVRGRHCWEIFAGQDARGDRLCCKDCPVMKSAASGVPVPRFDMSSRTGAGHLVSLEVCTLRSRPTRTAKLLVVHVFRAVARPLKGLVTEGIVVRHGPRVLTPRETEILGLLRDGGTSRSIAARLRISPATVRNHAQSILNKLGAHNRLTAVARALDRRLLS